VFLLTGVSSLLAILTNRVGRIIDRARVIEGDIVRLDEPKKGEAHEELKLLSQRARLVNRAIALCTVCALLVCVLIITQFVGAFLAVNFFYAIGSLFIFAMATLFIGLVSFLREIVMATRTVRIGWKSDGRV
jgi:Protein of unknown function (DUF2721)